jgi:malonate decarboxylase beta subunit
VEEFDSRDRALVWRTTGGKHRYLMGDCDVLVEDDVAAFRVAAVEALDRHRPLTLEFLEGEHSLLERRLIDAPLGADAVALWRSMGVTDAGLIPDLSAAEVVAARAG